MSWDVMIFTKDPRQFSGSVGPPPLGDAAEVREKISNALPAVDWSDPSWGVLDGEGWSLEFNHQEEGVSDSFMLHVRGGGDPVSAIVTLCKANDWVAFDCSTGDLINLDHPSSESWQGFQAFRDKVIGTAQPNPSPGFASEHPVILSVSILLLITMLYLMFKK